MANGLFKKYAQSLLDSSAPDLTSATVKVMLIDTTGGTGGEAINLSTDDNLDDIIAGARLSQAATLTSKTITDGVFDAADVDVTIDASQDPADGILIYVDTGVESTSTLIAYFDTGVTGLIYTPPSGGGTVQIRWHSSGIFSL